MRVALLGNMNNNGFSLLRYFRDLGVDAHLLLWSNDGKGSMAHFRPEDDTWSIETWRPYIHQTDIENSIHSLIGDPRRLRMPVGRTRVKKQLGGFDSYVGSGYGAAIAAVGGISLDIFYPHGTGVENVGDLGTRNYLTRAPLVKRLIVGCVRKRQISAIKKARNCVSAEMSLTRQTFNEIGKKLIPMAVPMVYNREAIPQSLLSKDLRDLGLRLRDWDVKVFSHCSHTWVRDTSMAAEQWEHRSKHNDWLIKGYAAFVKGYPSVKVVLMLLEYGPDVNATKEMCADLGIESNVIWLPRMSRKDLMYILGLCDLGVGEFRTERNIMWGGTGWEVLSSGKPLLQSVNFSLNEFLSLFGHELPPVLDVKSPEDISRHLIAFFKDREKYLEIGRRSKVWFEQNNGIGLAKKWLTLLNKSDSSGETYILDRINS